MHRTATSLLPASRDAAKTLRACEWPRPRPDERRADAAVAGDHRTSK
ncbi:hypothetical protein GLE_2062 [Lysobacter enzymogenes]|uniref:Uncharacterized protein n=1 Tax=Lysobacter enzymogenes TaxID=69 RepID=A0A0S2DFN7_LYSEN|nr:hypothetical protein GLE_2062 [Lysobacter enzymogenes]